MMHTWFLDDPDKLERNIRKIYSEFPTPQPEPSPALIPCPPELMVSSETISDDLFGIFFDIGNSFEQMDTQTPSFALVSSGTMGFQSLTRLLARRCLGMSQYQAQAGRDVARRSSNGVMAKGRDVNPVEFHSPLFRMAICLVIEFPRHTSRATNRPSKA
jgi:hypothetical protein